MYLSSDPYNHNSLLRPFTILATYHNFNVVDLSCPLCAKQYSRRDALNTHIRDIHENAGKTFFCELCNKSCKSVSALKMHMSNFHRQTKFYTSN